MSFSTQHDTQKNATVQSKEQEQEVVDVQKQEGQSHPKSDVDVSRKIINGSRVQPKLTMGSVGDKFEQEADETADKVMSKPMENSFSGGADDESPNVSKKAFLQAAEEETDTVNPKAETLEAEEQISKKAFLQTVSENEQVNQMAEEPEVAAMADEEQVSKKEETDIVNPKAAALESEEQISKKSFLQTVSEEETVSRKADGLEADETISKKSFLQAAEEESETVNAKEEAPEPDEQISKKDFLQTVLYDENKDVKSDMLNAKSEESDVVNSMSEETEVAAKTDEEQVSAKVEFPTIPGPAEVMKPGVQDGDPKAKKGKGDKKKGGKEGGAAEAPKEGEGKKKEGAQKGVIDIQKPKKAKKPKNKPPKVQKKDGTENNSGELDDAFEARLKSTKGGGRPMPKSTLKEMEQRFGRSFKNIRVHTGGEAAKLCAEIGAKAFTNGNHIYFNAGQFDPESMSGKLLLAHELTHTIQQGAAGKSSKVQREPFKPEGEPPAGKGKPSPIDDGAKVNKEGDSFMKDHDNYDEDNANKPVSEMDEDEKEQMNATSGESKEEQAEVEAKGVNKPKKARGKEAIEETVKEKAKIEKQQPEEEEKTENDEEGEKKEEEKSDAELAAERSEKAIQRAEELKDPMKFPEFSMPRLEKPKDADNKELPGDPELDHVVRGIAYLGKAIREHAFELLRHSFIQKKKAFSLDGVIEKQKEDLVNAETVVTNADDYSGSYKEASEKGKVAKEESNTRQEFTAAEAPKLKEVAEGAKGDASTMVEDTENQSKNNSKNLPTDADARKDAEEQGGEMDNMAVGALTIMEAIIFGTLSMETYIKDAEFAGQTNLEGQGQIEETDSWIEQYDARNQELKDGNTQTKEQLAAVEFGPEEMRERAASVEDGGYELYAATVVLETELIDIQEKYLNDMSKVKSVETLEKEKKEEEEAQKQGKAAGAGPGGGDLQLTEDQVSVISMGGMTQEEQEQFIADNPGKEEDFQVALDGLEGLIGPEEPEEGHDFTPEDTSFKNELLGRKREKFDTGFNKAVGLDHQDPRQAEFAPIEQERKKRLSKPLDIADKNMTVLSYKQKEMIAGNLVTDSMVYDVGNMFTWENAGKMAGQMAQGMIDPRMAISGVFGGFEKIGNGIINFSEHWKEDPLGAVLKAGADIATGIATIATSVLGICAMINAVMLAITVFGWMFPLPFTIPSMTWLGTVMTISGYTAMIAGALSFRLNQLMYQHNLHKAASATTAREFLGFSLDMKENVQDGATGLMSIAGGYGGVKMGKGFNMKNVVNPIKTPKRALATARKTWRGAKKMSGQVFRSVQKGMKRLASGGMKTVKYLRGKIKGLFGKLKSKFKKNRPKNIKHAGKGKNLGTLEGKPVKMEMDFPDGHKGKALNDGQCAICSNCSTIKKKYGKQLADNPDIDARLKKLEDDLKPLLDADEGSLTPTQKTQRDHMVAEQKALHDDLQAMKDGNPTPTQKALDDIDSPDSVKGICFAAGTKVKTPFGYSNIEELKVGDEVISYSEEARKLQKSFVTKLYTNWATKVVYITIGLETIKSTWSHPFWSVDKQRYIKAGDLSEGMKLFTAAGREEEITRIKLVEEEIDTFNLEVSGSHNYFVSEMDILVHNKTTSYVTNTTPVKSEIYGIIDTQTGKIMYVGKASGSSTMMTRFTQDHSPNSLKKFGVDFNAPANIGRYKPIQLASGNWNKFTTAMMEQHYINKHGMAKSQEVTGPGGRKRKGRLFNKIRAIGPEKFKLIQTILKKRGQTLSDLFNHNGSCS